MWGRTFQLEGRMCDKLLKPKCMENLRLISSSYLLSSYYLPGNVLSSLNEFNHHDNSMK